MNPSEGEPRSESTGPGRYSPIAVAFHWSVVLSVLLASGLALFREAFSAQAVWMISAHKIIGLGILVLGLGRLGWRIGHRPPVLPASVGRREQRLVASVHGLLYCLMLFVPIAGWAFVSMAPTERPLDYRGLDNIPRLPLAVDDRTSFVWHEVHEILGFVFLALILMHVVGVLRHELAGDGGIADRMIPRRRWLLGTIIVAVVLWLAGLSLDLLGIRIT